MTIVSKPVLATVAAAAIIAAAALPPADGRAQSASATGSADGARLYQAKCGSCHSLTANRIGPAHKGVFGRKAAMVEGYNYSPALRKSGLAWDAKTLDQWLQGPQKLAPGSKMYLVVANPAERAAIIAYLQSDAAR